MVSGNSTNAKSLGFWMAVRWSVYGVAPNRPASWAGCYAMGWRASITTHDTVWGAGNYPGNSIP